jgi:outer membrane murein-binding lipoprotein Lpp
MKFPLGAIVCGITLLSGRVLAEEAKLDRAKVLAELKEIEAKNEKLTQGLLEKAAKELTEAGGDKFKAVQVYLDSYRNVEFGRAQDGDSRYQQWRIDNKEKISSLNFSEAVQLHVQYVGLVCRQALGEKEAPKAGEWGTYWEHLLATKDKVENVVDVPQTQAKVEKKTGVGRRQAKQTGDDFTYPALESPLVRDRQIQGFLGEVKEAAVSSSSVGAVFNQVVRPHLRKAKSRDLVRLWDLRIAAMDEGMGKEVKTLGLDDYKVLKRPELMWERADDLEKMGEQESAWAKKMEIIKSCPYHPKLAEWIGEMKQALGEGSPALPEKAP